MIRHIVMYKLKQPTTQNCEALRKAFLSMKGLIPELIDINAGVDILGSERSFDVVLECLFQSVDTMNAYKTHPIHLPIMAYVKENVAVSHSVDYIE